MADSLIPVAVACPCPGTPHSDGDTVFMGPFLSLEGGMLAEALMVRSWARLENSGKELRQTEASLAVEAALRRVYVADGVREWTFVDAEGEDIEVTEESVRTILLSNFTLSRPVGDKADELYTTSVLDPLLKQIKKSSRSSPRRESTETSPTQTSGSKRPKPPKPSLITSTGKEPLSA